MYSVFDIFKIGIGPSSYHTGIVPMKTAKQFVDDLTTKAVIRNISAISMDVYGSISRLSLRGNKYV